MAQFNSFNNSSGNNFFGLVFVIPLTLHTTVLIAPTESYAKTTEPSHENTKRDNGAATTANKKDPPLVQYKMKDRLYYLTNNF